jgi:hypothetical protein
MAFTRIETRGISTTATIEIDSINISGISTFSEISVGNIYSTGIVTAPTVVITNTLTGPGGVGYATEGYVSNSLVGYATEGYVSNSLVGYATEGYVSNSLVGYATEGYVSNSLVGYATEGYVSNSLVGYATEGYVSNSLVGYATEGYVTQQVNNLIDEAPGALDTLNELAAALNDDASFSTTVTNSLAQKANLSGANFTGVVTATNLNISGVSTFQGHVYLGDNDKIVLGDGGDFEIYHSGFNSIIRDVGTGGLIVDCDSLLVRNASGNETGLTFTNNSSVDLYYDNSKKFETTGAGATVLGTLQTQQLNVSGVSTFQSSVSIGTTIDIVPYDSLGTLSFEGSAGQLFSITNNLTSGSIFSVNDVSGIPSIDVNADGTIELAPYGGNVSISGAVETVSIASTYDLGGGRVILECNAQNGTVFTHDLTNGIVGIVSLRNFPVTKNSITTFTILFTQNATGTANTTPTTGIGTNITLTPLGVSGFTTSARVATASTVTLSTTANDVDFVSLAVHYNGSGTGTSGNYKTFASGNTGFRFGTVGF